MYKNFYALRLFIQDSKIKYLLISLFFLTPFTQAETCAKAFNFRASEALFNEVQQRHPNLSRIKLAIEQGANVNAHDKDGITALMHAAYRNQSKVVQMLMEAGADSSLRDNRERTVFDWIKIMETERAWEQTLYRIRSGPRFDDGYLRRPNQSVWDFWVREPLGW